MEILYLLIPMAVVIVGLAGAVLLWALKHGQFDGLDQIAQRLPDDER